MFSERARLRLANIVEDSDRVATFVGTMTVEAFERDEKTLLAVERLFSGSPKPSYRSDRTI